MQWQNHLAFPDDVHLSYEAIDLIKRCVPLLGNYDLELTLKRLQTGYLG